jgi:4-hydroxy-3-methylbut-2-enyl diphosphate reductase
MKVITAHAMGLCFGVRDALAVAHAIERPAQVTVFGQLVHNPLVTRDLDQRGFHQVDEPGRGLVPLTTPVLLITAHGISNRERAKLAAMGKHLIDSTCPLVKKAHDAALRLARENRFVIVIGRRNHVEIRGLTGDLARFAVVESMDDVRRYEAERLGILAQNTSVERVVQMIVARIRALNAHADIKFVNTICQPTRDRQAALEALLSEVDVLVAVGGRHSNNTRQLVARAAEAGIRAIHIEDASELAESMFTPGEIVGLTAGTSTLPQTIGEVREKLQWFHTASPDPSRRYASLGLGGR